MPRLPGEYPSPEWIKSFAIFVGDSEILGEFDFTFWEVFKVTCEEVPAILYKYLA